MVSYRLLKLLVCLCFGELGLNLTQVLNVSRKSNKKTTT